MRWLFLAASLAVAAAPSAHAQVAEVLRNTLEGRTVVVRIDMPAIDLGIDVWPERVPPLDEAELVRRKQEFGIAIPKGTSYTVTKIAVSHKLIELLLGWGGAPLERDQRLPDMGSRLRIHYEHGVPTEALTPHGFAAVVADYLDLSTPTRTGIAAAGETATQPPAADLGALKPGLTRSEVEALLGSPFESLRRQEEGRPLRILSFRTAEGTLQAVFERERLVRWSLEPR